MVTVKVERNHDLDGSCKTSASTGRHAIGEPETVLLSSRSAHELSHCGGAGEDHGRALLGARGSRSGLSAVGRQGYTVTPSRSAPLRLPAVSSARSFVRSSRTLIRRGGTGRGTKVGARLRARCHGGVSPRSGTREVLAAKVQLQLEAKEKLNAE